MPLLLPIFAFVLITSMIGGLQMFDVPQILTNGIGQSRPDEHDADHVPEQASRLAGTSAWAAPCRCLIFFVTASLSMVLFRTMMRQYNLKNAK